MGKPFVMSTDGPGTFSCSGLMRYILRTTGVDADAPWVPEAYLSKYAPVDPASIQPGDIVIMPNWATMYAGNGMLLNANEVKGMVTHTPMSVAGIPLGIVRPPYAGQAPVEATQPLNEPTDPLAQPPVEPTNPPAQPPIEMADPLAQPIEATDPMMSQLPVEATDPLAQPIETIDPLAQPTGVTDPLAQPVIDATDPMMSQF